MRILDLLFNWLKKLFKNSENGQLHIDETVQKDQSLPKSEKSSTETSTNKSTKTTENAQYTLNTKDITMTFKDGTQYTALLTVNKIPLHNEKVVFSINGKEYNRKTDLSGRAYLTINLNPNKYTIKTTSHNITNTNTITVKSRPNTKTDNVKGIFVRSKDADSIPLSKLKDKGYTHLFISHMYYLNNNADKLNKFVEKAHKQKLKVIVFYTTYFNGDEMVNPTSQEASNRIHIIEKIGKTKVDGVCLDYNRHNSSNHSEKIMNKITENTNKVVADLKDKEVYATCMAEHPSTLKSYYHQDIAKWKATPLTMLYRYNYNYTDKQMKSEYASLKKANSKLIPIFQNYKGDDNVVDIGSKQLKHDIDNVGSKDYLIFRYGTGTY